MNEKFYEREGAVFRKREGQSLEIYGQHSGKFSQYTGDANRVIGGGSYGGADVVTLEQAREFMDVAPVDYPETQPA